MSDNMLDRMEAKLQRLELEFSELYETAPWVGAMGTPFTDNAKGKAYKRACIKHGERMDAKARAINEQKEKIERMQMRIQRQSTPTKKSEKFLDKNPVSPILLWLADQGLVKPWARNPYVFFVVGLDKVALITVGDRVGINKKYCAKDEVEKQYCLDLIERAKRALERQ